ncbi:MAG: hypothetical protein Q4C04_05710 [Clostridia bacterium]|nr:hypothetical protein [Clostridia bacterium]
MISVFEQWASSLLMLYGGLALGLADGILRCVRARCISKLAGIITDAAFVLSFFCSFSCALFYASGGILRFYLVLWFVLGFLLFRAAFFPLFTRILKKIHKK